MKNPPFAEIPEDEYHRRLRRLQADMSILDLDAVLMFCEENHAYWAGYRRTYESPTVQWGALMVPRKGDPVFIIMHGMYFLARKTSHVQDIRPFGGAPYWNLPKDPIVETIKAIQPHLPANGRIGLELGFGMHMRISINEIDRLRRELAAHTLVDAADFIWRQKMVKTPWEIDLYRTLGDITAKGFLSGLLAVREGVTEREIMKVMMDAWADFGAFDTPMRSQLMMRSGPDRYDMFTARPWDRVIERGDQIFFDSGPCYKGYLTDIQRHAAIGQPPKLCMDLFEQSRLGLEAAIAAIKPGVLASEIFEAACQGMATGVNQNIPWVFFGHGLGLTNHELPFIIPDDHTPLEAGMVLSVEVPAYDVPDFRVLGAFLEEVVLVTETGAEVLTSKCPRDYWIVQ